MLSLEVTYTDNSGRRIPVIQNGRSDLIAAVVGVIADSIREIARAEADPVMATLFYGEAKRAEDLVEVAGGEIGTMFDSTCETGLLPVAFLPYRRGLTVIAVRAGGGDAGG